MPHEVETDELTNIEFGWKVDTLGDTLRINGSLFMSEIERLQTTIFDTNIVNLYFSDNAADAEVLGLEGDVTWLPSWVPGLTVSGAFSFLDTEVTTVHLPTNRVVEGDELAYAPSFQANLSARYEWVVGGNKTAHIMPYVTHSGEVFTDIITINRHQLDAWTLLGVTAGVSTENWRAELYIDNLTDAAAQVSGNFINDRLRVNLAPPRTMGFRVSYDFGL